MVILSEDKASSLTLEVDGVEQERFPSLNLFARVADKDFSGSNDAWVSRDEVQTFLTQLGQCEQTRHGQAVLLVPEHLELAIEQSDGWGHFVLRYHLSGSRCASRRGGAHSVSGEFDLDAELFAQTVADLTELFTDAWPDVQKPRWSDHIRRLLPFGLMGRTTP